MARTQLTVLDAVIVEQDIEFSFVDLCRACGAEAERLRSLVDEGLLQPRGNGPADWVFDGRAMSRARTALRLSRELDVGAHATALMLELIDEIDALKARLRRAGIE